jgi:hypothetical protein
MTTTSSSAYDAAAHNVVKRAEQGPQTRIGFLHHSTGRAIWNGGKGSIISRVKRKLGVVFGCKVTGRSLMQSLFIQNNRRFGTKYKAEALIFPKETPYGWNNYPFDYYNIWVKNAGPKPFLQEPTLELLTQEYQLIMFKHCYPVSNIQPDRDAADINSDYKSLANYKLQYLALRDKLHQFPNTNFIVWTGAAQVKPRTHEDEAKRSREFSNWVMNEWDLPDDNIFVWDFYGLQTEGQLYFQDKFSQLESNSHPNDVFSKSAARLLFQRMVDVIESGGTATSPTGARKARP